MAELKHTLIYPSEEAPDSLQKKLTQPNYGFAGYSEDDDLTSKQIDDLAKKGLAKEFSGVYMRPEAKKRILEVQGTPNGYEAYSKSKDPESYVSIAPDDEEAREMLRSAGFVPIATEDAPEGVIPEKPVNQMHPKLSPRMREMQGFSDTDGVARYIRAELGLDAKITKRGFLGDTVAVRDPNAKGSDRYWHVLDPKGWQGVDEFVNDFRDFTGDAYTATAAATVTAGLAGMGAFASSPALAGAALIGTGVTTALSRQEIGEYLGFDENRRWGGAAFEGVMNLYGPKVVGAIAKAGEKAFGSLAKAFVNNGFVRRWYQGLAKKVGASDAVIEKMAEPGGAKYLSEIAKRAKEDILQYPAQILDQRTKASKLALQAFTDKLDDADILENQATTYFSGKEVTKTAREFYQDIIDKGTYLTENETKYVNNFLDVLDAAIGDGVEGKPGAEKIQTFVESAWKQGLSFKGRISKESLDEIEQRPELFLNYAKDWLMLDPQGSPLTNPGDIKYANDVYTRIARLVESGKFERTDILNFFTDKGQDIPSPVVEKIFAKTSGAVREAIYKSGKKTRELQLPGMPESLKVSTSEYRDTLWKAMFGALDVVGKESVDPQNQMAGASFETLLKNLAGREKGEKAKIVQEAFEKIDALADISKDLSILDNPKVLQEKSTDIISKALKDKRFQQEIPSLIKQRRISKTRAAMALGAGAIVGKEFGYSPGASMGMTAGVVGATTLRNFLYYSPMQTAMKRHMAIDWLKQQPVEYARKMAGVMAKSPQLQVFYSNLWHRSTAMALDFKVRQLMSEKGIDLKTFDEEGEMGE